MVADSYMSTETQIGSHTLPPYTIVQQVIVYVYGTLVAYTYVLLCRYINPYRHGVMVADSYKSTGAQIGSHTLPPYDIVQ